MMITTYLNIGFSPFLLVSAFLCMINNIVPTSAFLSIQSGCNSLPYHSQTHLFSHDVRDIEPVLTCSRRNAFKTTFSALLPLQYLVSSPKHVYAESTGDLPNGLLETRVLENVLSPPPYGIESSDIQYPR